LSVTHGQCDARPTVTFPVTGHRCPATGTKLYCLVTEAHVCEQLVEGRYLTEARPGVELATSRVASQRLNHYTIRSQQTSASHLVRFCICLAYCGVSTVSWMSLTPAAVEPALIYRCGFWRRTKRNGRPTGCTTLRWFPSSLVSPNDDVLS